LTRSWCQRRSRQWHSLLLAPALALVPRESPVLWPGTLAFWTVVWGVHVSSCFSNDVSALLGVRRTSRDPFCQSRDRRVDLLRSLQGEHVARVADLDQLRARPRSNDLFSLFARGDVDVVPDEDGPGQTGKIRDDVVFIVPAQVIEEAQVRVQRRFVDHVGVQVDDLAVRGAGEHRDRERRGDQAGDLVAQPANPFRRGFQQPRQTADNAQIQQLRDTVRSEAVDRGGYLHNSRDALPHVLRGMPQRGECNLPAEGVTDEDQLPGRRALGDDGQDVLRRRVRRTRRGRHRAGLAVTAQVEGEEAYARQVLTQPAELAVPGVRAEGEAVDKHDRQRFRVARLRGRVAAGTYLIPAQGDVRAAVADGEDAGGVEVADSRPDLARCAGLRG